MDSFYFVDKPLGISSFDIIRILRKRFNIKKMGHTGTLDPLATGGMLIATGKYTKLIPHLEKATKVYEFTVNLDGVTSSLDLAEDVVYISQIEQEKFKKEITIEKIEKLIQKRFLGEIVQVPPKYSAIKVNGKRAYDLARKGQEVKMKSRKVTIFEHEVLDFDYPELTLRARVSAGTYIRTIAGDLGKYLGTGAYISALRRTYIGNLDVSKATELDSLKSENFIGVDKVLNKKYFLENIDEKHLSRLNDGLERLGEFNLEIEKPYFIYDGTKITNIVKYDGEKLIPLKKL